jgi:hypothetical protein
LAGFHAGVNRGRRGDSSPLRAIRTVMPRSSTQRRSSVVSLCLVRMQFADVRRRGRRRRDRTARMAHTRGRGTSASLVSAVAIWTDKRMPARSDNTSGFEPGLPRSTGLGPVRSPPHFARTEAASITALGQSIKPWLPAGGARPGVPRIGHTEARNNLRCTRIQPGRQEVVRRRRLRWIDDRNCRPDPNYVHTRNFASPGGDGNRR